MKPKDIELIAAGCAREAKLARQRKVEEARKKARGAASPGGLLSFFPGLKVKAAK